MLTTAAFGAGAGRVRAGHRVRVGARRVRSSWWTIGQSALGGAIAWEVAVHVLHHPAPFFATVAAIVCLSISQANRLRRVVEMALGVTLGVGLGDVIVGQIGRGGWQLGLVVMIAMSAALMLDGGNLIVNQAALQAVFVVVLPTPPGGYIWRWEDALVGGITALAVAVALPADARPTLRRHCEGVTRTVAAALRSSVAAARAGDVEQANAALDLLRGTQFMIDRWWEAVFTGEEIARLSPLRRHTLPEVRAHRRGLGPTDRAIRNLRVALRRVVASIEDEHAYLADGRHSTMLNADQQGLPEPLLAALEQLAGALHTIPSALRDNDGEGGRRMRAAVTGVGHLLDPQALGARSMTATVVVAQARSAVVDLLQVTGLSEPQARAALPR